MHLRRFCPDELDECKGNGAENVSRFNIYCTYLPPGTQFVKSAEK